MKPAYEGSVSMKKIIIGMITAAVLVLALSACGQEQEKKTAADNDKCDVAMISENGDDSGTSFTQTAWDSVQSFAEEKGLTAKLYKPKKSTDEAYLASVKKAAGDGAGLIVMAGSGFESAAYEAQSVYPDTDFLLIDGVPHDAENSYVSAANTVSIVFSEEEAGYMAGYAAVMDGYAKLGFIGGQALPEIKRYGYGFVQGAAAAAAETETRIEIDYKYTSAEQKAADIRELAAGLYKNGTEVIFACGGSVSRPVIKAAEKNNGKVIGADVDQSSLSETVITSACKNTDTAVRKVLDSYADDSFSGGTAFNYAARNNGVSLEMKNSSFKKFSEEDYKKLFRQLKNGKIDVKKDTEVKALSEITGEWVTVRE